MMEQHPDQVRLVKLGAPDAQALDALLESAAAGDEASHRAAEESPRGKVVSQFLDLIGYLPGAAPPDDLVQRTLSHIQAATDREAVIGRIEPEPSHQTAATSAVAMSSMTSGIDAPAPPAIAFRWSELIAVAAVMLIAMSLLFPIMSRTRTDSMRIACASNLATAGVAMNHYAADNQRVLPRYRVQPGQIWWNVGKPFSDGAGTGSASMVVQSNSANLYKLRRGNYASAAALNCPANPEAPSQMAVSAFDWPNPRAVSYSYQNQYTAEPFRLGRVSGIVVLADKNPLFTPDAADSSSLIFNAAHGLDAPGNRHAQPGQSVLVIDNSVLWLQKPFLNSDNFHTAMGIDSYTGTESPAMLGDSFVVP